MGATTARIAILAVMLASMGCASLGDHYTVYIDPAFSAVEQEAAIAAADGWRSARPVTLETLIAPCSGRHDGDICIHLSDSATVLRIANDNEAHAGVTVEPDWQVNGAEVWIATAAVQSAAVASPWFTEENFAHELGHAMGLQHQNGIGALMDKQPSASSRGPVTCADAAQWSNLRGRSEACP